MKKKLLLYIHRVLLLSKYVGGMFTRNIINHIILSSNSLFDSFMQPCCTSIELCIYENEEVLGESILARGASLLLCIVVKELVGNIIWRMFCSSFHLERSLQHQHKYNALSKVLLIADC